MHPGSEKMDDGSVAARHETDFRWPHSDTSQTPYRVYTDETLYALEQQRIFQGPVWNFIPRLCNQARTESASASVVRRVSA